LEHPAIAAHDKTVNLALPDVTLRLDLEGVIHAANLANAVSGETTGGWMGQRWADTVGEAGGAMVLGMLADARENGVSDVRQVTQRFPSGLELPMEYNTVRLGGHAGLIAIGRNLAAVTDVQSRLLAAQHARELDSWKLRAVETRNRLLFETSDEPILLLSMGDLGIVEANPAAVRAGALDGGRDFSAAIAPQDRDAYRAMIGVVREQGRANGIVVHIGASRLPWLVRAVRTEAEPEPVLQVRLSPAAPAPLPATEPALESLIERIPDGFAVIDGEGVLRRANRAFLNLAQIPVAGAALGQNINRWFARPGADAAVLLASLRRHRVLRGFATSLQGDLGTVAEVEISAAGDRDSDPAHIGLLVRDVTAGRRAPATATPENPLLAPLAAMTSQIGDVPLLQLVRDTGALIERHCIEIALERALGNRTAAAGLLGLSRQSLYAKLSRYGLGSAGEEPEGA
jgi:transcriptional regulator PpsR